MPDPRDQRMARLCQALDLYLDADGAPEAKTVRPELASLDPELRELVEPMLTDDDDETVTLRAGGVCRRIGDYQLVREIGRGGMGVVFEAEQVSLGRRVALKLLPLARSMSPRAIVRFNREASMAAALDHPGIVKVHAKGVEDETHYFAMDLVRGAPLDEVIDELSRSTKPPHEAGELLDAVACRMPGRPTDGDLAVDADESFVARVARIGLQLAEALAHAHAHGVLHRDVKPANVLLLPNGRPVLTDFGLARDDSRPALTRSGDFAGTPHYIAPETLGEDGEQVDGRADVFGLGATLYELLTLRKAFAADSVAAVLHAIAHREPTDPLRLRRDLPADLVAIVMRALEKKPARRYAGAAELAQDLRAFLTFRPVQARRPTVRERVARWLRREPLRAATIGLALVVAITASWFAAFYVGTEQQREVGAASIQNREVDGLLIRAYTALRHSYLARAAGLFDDALALDPSRIEAVAGRVLVEESYQGGMQQFERHAAHLRTDLAMLRLRAMLLRGLGRSREAEVIERGLSAPQSAYDRFLVGVAITNSRDGVSAEDRTRACRLLHSAVLTTERAPELYCVEWLRAEIDRGDLNGIARARQTVQQRFPDSVAAKYWLAHAAAVEDPAEGAARMQAVAEGAPDWGEAWTNLAAFRLRTGDAVGAVSAARRGVQLLPTAAEAHVNLGAALNDLDRETDAMASYRKAIAVDEKCVRAHLYLGDLQLYTGDVDGAEASFVRASELEPGTSMPWRELARVAQARGDTDRAIRFSATAFGIDGNEESGKFLLSRSARWIELMPDSARAWQQRAVALATEIRARPAAERTGLVDGLRRAADRSVELSKRREPSILVTWAQVSAMLGDVDRALAALADVEQLIADGAEARGVGDLGELRRQLRALQRSDKR